METAKEKEKQNLVYLLEQQLDLGHRLELVAQEQQ